MTNLWQTSRHVGGLFGAVREHPAERRGPLQRADLAFATHLRELFAFSVLYSQPQCSPFVTHNLPELLLGIQDVFRRRKLTQHGLTVNFRIFTLKICLPFIPANELLASNQTTADGCANSLKKQQEKAMKASNVCHPLYVRVFHISVQSSGSAYKNG